jgi:hypothetical protein
MFDTAEGWREGFAMFTIGLDPDTFTGVDARAVFEELARMEKLAAAAKVLFAARVAQTGAWKGDGDRDEAHWLARMTGCSLGVAIAQLKTAERLEDLPAAKEAFRAGDLSETQAKHIADAATVDPTKEQELVDLAGTESVGEIVAETRRIKGSQGNQQEKAERIHQRRRLRKWCDTEGAFQLSFTNTAVVGAEINALMEPFIDAIWRQARTDGRAEPRQAYAADALLEMLRLAAGTKTTDLDLRKVVDAKIIVHVPYDTYLAGHPIDDKSCEIENVGPIPVSAVDDLLTHHNPFIAAVVEKGVDIASVTHFGRRPNALQVTALQARGVRCTRQGCNNTARLQADHRKQWRITKHTRIDELDLLCVDDHRRKDIEGWQLEPGVGRRRLLPPGHPDLDTPETARVGAA